MGHPMGRPMRRPMGLKRRMELAMGPPTWLVLNPMGPPWDVLWVIYDTEISRINQWNDTQDSSSVWRTNGRLPMASLESHGRPMERPMERRPM